MPFVFKGLNTSSVALPFALQNCPKLSYKNTSRIDFFGKSSTCRSLSRDILLIPYKGLAVCPYITFTGCSVGVLRAADTTERIRNTVHRYDYAVRCNVRQPTAIKLPEMRHTQLDNHLKPTGHVMHQQFNIQQLYFLPTLYLCVLYLSENKQRLVPLTA